jgi:hypothetical protein
MKIKKDMQFLNVKPIVTKNKKWSILAIEKTSIIPTMKSQENKR